MSMLESCNYVTPEFLLNCQDIFDQAELAAGASELVLRRLRHARLALDKATYIFFYKIANDAPFTREQIATRIRYTVNEQYNMRTLDSATARANKDRFLQFLDFEVMLENCDNIGKSTWSQLAWHPNAFKNEEVGTLALSTENKVEGTGSIQWTVTKQEVDAKPGLSVIRMNYLYGADIARISALKFYVKCEKSNHPPVFASLYGSNTGNYSNVQVLARGEVTNGWKEIVWNLGAETGRVQTHAYFRLFAVPGDFQVNDVLEIYLDSIIAQR
jgi:hypothetical protein